jgi:hypothetical protein
LAGSARDDVGDVSGEYEVVDERRRDDWLPPIGAPLDDWLPPLSAADYDAVGPGSDETPEEDGAPEADEQVDTDPEPGVRTSQRITIPGV